MDILIPLHSSKYPGLFATVDVEDYDLVSRYRWNPCKKGNTFYAKTKIGGATVLMHRLLTGYSITDHINGFGLDNRRKNLREVTTAQNLRNCRRRCDNTSGFKGVAWHKPSGKWQVHINVDGKFTYLGLFSDKIAAARAYDAAALEHYGEYARLNFSEVL